MSDRKKVNVSVDSIDGNVAVLVGSNHSVTMPVSWLPDGVSEGTALELTTRLATQDEEELTNRVSDLQNRLKRR